jgi:hypothetical protein
MIRVEIAMVATDVPVQGIVGVSQIDARWAIPTAGHEFEATDLIEPTIISVSTEADERE